MVMAAHIPTNMLRPPMTTSADILTLTQLFSPSYPLGSFAYSHGLETAIHAGDVATVDELRVWLEDLIEYGGVRNDVILLRCAYEAKSNAECAAINSAARAFAASSERLMEADLQGAAFARTTSAIWGGDAHDLAHPVAIGAAARRLALPVDLTAVMYAQAFVSNLVSAAVRLVPLGQTEGQATLAKLSPLCADVVEKTTGATLDDLSGTTFSLDIAAMRHETLQPRIFRS